VKGILAVGCNLTRDGTVIMFGDQPLKSFSTVWPFILMRLTLRSLTIPPEKVRLHVCWGNWNGPHQDDVDMMICCRL
jgi:5-methyltetrahydropteroyltriglutamate--homocysteine methyltransferase